MQPSRERDAVRAEDADRRRPAHGQRTDRLDDVRDARRALAHNGAWQRPLIEKSDGIAVVPDRIHGNADSAGVDELLRFGYALTALVAA